MNIFLDDIRNPTKSYMGYMSFDYDSKSWQIVRNFLEFKSLINMNNKINILSIVLCFVLCYNVIYYQLKIIFFKTGDQTWQH